MIRCLVKNGVPVLQVQQGLQVQNVRFYAIRSVTGASKYDRKQLDKAPGARKVPCPHEDILIQNAGRYPPHLKIDMDHPENWPKHFPPFHEGRRPDKWPLWRAVAWCAAVWVFTLTFLCPRWVIPIIYPNFPVISYYSNWGYENRFPDEIGEDADTERSIYIPQRAGTPGKVIAERGDGNIHGRGYDEDWKPKTN